MKNCLECGSEKIVPEAKVFASDNRNRRVEIAVEKNPEAFIFKNKSYSNIKAKVCAECGFIAFFATNPHLLWETYQRRQNDVS